MRWWARRRLRAKIFLPFSALILATLLSTLWLINSALSSQVEGTLRAQLQVTGQVFRGLVSERARRVTADTLLLAADFALKRAIATYDPETLATVAVNYRERIDLELLWITDESGTLLADAGGHQPAGRAIGDLPPLHEAIAEGHAAAALNELDGALFVFVAVPVFAPDPIGFLLAGSAIDDRTAAALEKQTGSAVTFATAGRVFASSWPAAERAALLPAGGLSAETPSHGDAATFMVQRGAERLLSLRVPIEASLSPPLFALIQQSYDRALEPLYAVRRRVALIGAMALAAALAVGALLAGGIAAPLQTLVGAMHDVLAGNLRRRMEVRRDDEIGFLARSFNEMVAGLEEREAIKDLFGRFVSRDVAAAVLGGGAALAGERREVTILFQDVRDFTRLAEHAAPDALVHLVNRLMTEMVAAVEDEGGTIRQFTGDGVMALFGAPARHSDDPERAVRAALSMVDRLPRLNRDLAAEGFAPLRIGVGIHTGDVVVGKIGPDERVEYSVVGDAVNLAGRIEGLTKTMQAVILISGATAARLGPAFRLGRRAVVPVRGKEQPVEVVEVLGGADPEGAAALDGPVR